MIGIDEAGRGSLIGSVYACACFFETGTLEFENELKDSKKLSELQRLTIYKKLITSSNVKFALGFATLEEIEKLNILNASLLAMERAFNKLNITNKQVLIDGNKKPKNLEFAQCIIKGDTKIKQISAASIIAKVERDLYINKIAEEEPKYLFQKNKGYGTKAHIEAIKNYGISKFHRPSFLRKII